MPQDFMFGGCVHGIDVLRAFGGDVRRVHAVARKGNLTAEQACELTDETLDEWADAVALRRSWAEIESLLRRGGMSDMVEKPGLL